jgi:glycosyltransferase involved in cell wall biosynthesis
MTFEVSGVSFCLEQDTFMAMQSTQLTSSVGSAARLRESVGHPVLCHFTTMHTELKSRSFYMEFMPLAAGGAEVRYVAPAGIEGHRDGVDFVPLQKPRGRIGQLRSIPAVLQVLLRQRADLYHFQDPELLPAALLLKLIFRKKVVFDSYEDFAAMALTMRGMPRALRPIVAAGVGCLQRVAALCFDGVMTADSGTLRRVARVGHSRKLTFYNFPNLEVFPAPKASAAKDFDVVYRGGLSERAGTWVLLEAVRLLAVRGKKVRVLLIGYCDDGEVQRALRERVESLGLAAQVEIMGRIRHSEMAQALGRARIGICPLQDIAKFRVNIPVKVFEYWACGLPVIASDLPPIRPFFKNVHGGILFSPSDAGELAQAIAWLLAHPASSAHMGRRGREAVVQRFNHRREVRKLERFFARIAGTSSRTSAG